LHAEITAVGALATIWALVSGCDASVGIGGPATVDKKALQTDIANRLAKAGEQPESVRCEQDLVGEVGATAHCDVDAGGVSLRRTVEVNSVEGLMMNFDVVPLLIKEEVASSLLDEVERQLGRRPDSAQCAGNLEGKVGNTVDCTIVTGSDRTSFTLTVTTVSGGSIRYSYAPRP
jgi:Domain of unknown function (DUF4333)